MTSQFTSFKTSGRLIVAGLNVPKQSWELPTRLHGVIIQMATLYLLTGFCENPQYQISKNLSCGNRADTRGKTDGRIDMKNLIGAYP